MFEILLVDDYEMNVEILEAYLKKSKLPLNMHKAYDGKSALEILAKQKMDIVLLDVMLPDISGIEICKIIKKKDPNLPVVLITALKDRKNLHDGLLAEADEYLTKPVDSNELILRLKNLLTIRKLYVEKEERYQKLRKELGMAQMLQQSFLPKNEPNYQNLQIESVYMPCSFVGGDFYDYLPNEKGIGIFIADVKGKGIASAMVTATLKDNLQRLREEWARPDVLLRELNRALNEFFAHGMEDYFVTAFYGIVNASKEVVIYSNAGHCPPLLLGEEAVEIDTDGGFPLGLFAESRYELKVAEFPFGGQMFCYTDGIFELKLFGRDWHEVISVKELLDKVYPEGFGRDELEELKKEIRNNLNEDIDDDINYIALYNSGGKKND